MAEDFDNPGFVPLPSLTAGRHQLPAPPQPFVGRDEELRDLMAHMSTSPVAIHSARESPGIGKTALALTLAHRVKPYYSDAQLYVDLQGDSDHPLSTADAMAHMVQCMLPGAAPPDDPAELLVHYRSAIAEKRALLLLDNAASAEQVSPLLPPESCACIITSRRELGLPGTHAIELQPLNERDAQDLLLQLAPRIGNAAAELANLCSGVPLALCTAGGLLAHRADVDPGTYIRQFVEHRNVARALSASDLTLSFNHELMLPDKRHRWQALCVFPAGFDDLAAASVWDLPQLAARQALTELNGRSLVRYNPPTGRYRLHDRARAVVSASIAPTDRLAAQRRHAVHYAAVSAVASALCDREPLALFRGMAFFRLEWPNISAAMSFASAGIPGDLLAAQLCSTLAESAAAWLLLRIPPADRLRCLESALAGARAGDDARAQRIHLRHLITSHEALGNARRAREYAGELLTLSIDEEASALLEDPAKRITRIKADLPRARLLWQLGRARAAAADLPGTLAAWREAAGLFAAAAT